MRQIFYKLRSSHHLKTQEPTGKALSSRLSGLFAHLVFFQVRQMMARLSSMILRPTPPHLVFSQVRIASGRP